MLLEVKEIHSFYGPSHILFGISLHVEKGEIVCLLGRNGTGKSTTLKSIIGLVRPRQGSITWEGQEIMGQPPFRNARQGIGYVPEDRRILPDLTVWENLEIARRKTGKGNGGWTFERVYALFPILQEREKKPGGTLSGGEQQMLAIARTLMLSPQLLLLDEPSQGLAPLVLKHLSEQIQKLKASAISILLAEQNQDFALSFGDRAYIIEKGTIQFDGSAQNLKEDFETRKRYLGV
jgi:branched-chain amino acid transport system ATP-binding protein